MLIRISSFIKLNYLIIAVVVLLITFNAIGQPLIKSKQKPEIWSSLSYEAYIKNKNRIFYETNFRFVTSSVFSKISMFPFKRIQFMLGYEWILSEKWYAGISEQLAIEPDSKIYFTGIFLGHKGKLSDLEFIKRFRIEYVSYDENRNNVGSRGDNIARLSFYFHFTKQFKIGNIRVKPILSYELFRWHEFSEVERKKKNQRRIDKTRLKFDFNVFISNKLNIGVFVMKEVDYYFSLSTGGRYNKDGVLIQSPQPERKNNRITPTYGINLLYSRGSAK